MVSVHKGRAPLRLTVDLLCRCTGHAAKRRRDETPEQFLSRITHLYCSERGIESIENLHLCRNLISLYLYDNQINKIERLNGNTPLLTHLYLQNNRISKLENLNMLRRLTKLYLSHNSIRVVEGLEELSQLAELHIGYQKLPKGEKLHFDPRTMRSLSSSLVVLNVSGNCLDTLEDFTVLVELQQLMANDNELNNMKDLAKALSKWLKLWKLELNCNPLALKQKYRDRVVTMCHKLELLDGKEVSELERQFLFSWKAMRKARHQYMMQKAMNFSETKIPDQPLVYQPLSMPALPARQPPRLQYLQEKRRRLMRQAAEEASQPSSELHLPQISSTKRVMLTTINHDGNALLANHTPNVLPLHTL